MLMGAQSAQVQPSSLACKVRHNLSGRDRESKCSRAGSDPGRGGGGGGVVGQGIRSCGLIWPYGGDRRQLHIKLMRTQSAQAQPRSLACKVRHMLSARESKRSGELDWAGGGGGGEMGHVGKAAFQGAL